jgi:hypothetical protein
MTTDLERELVAAHRIVAHQHEIVTCWRSMYVPGELRFVPLPPEMEAIIRSSADYDEVAGGAPTLLSIASGNEALELVLYRASADGAVYMLAPVRH